MITGIYLRCICCGSLNVDAIEQYVDPTGSRVDHQHPPSSPVVPSGSTSKINRARGIPLHWCFMLASASLLAGVGIGWETIRLFPRVQQYILEMQLKNIMIETEIERLRDTGPR